MKKKGISHLEVILAFVIFVAAIGFALYLFNPGDSSRQVKTYLTYTFTEIIRQTTTNVETYSVKINGDLITEDEIALNISGARGKARVLTYDGLGLESYKANDSDVVNVKRGANQWGNIDFVNVLLSEDFENGIPFTGELNESYYEISSSYDKEVISEKRFNKLIEKYNSDYEALRGEFNLKIGLGFSLKFENGDEIKAEKEIPTGLEVFSDSKRVEVLRENGAIEYGDLTVKVW